MSGVRWRSVRLRMVLAAVVVLGVLLVAAAIGFEQLLRSRLIDNLDSSLQSQTVDRAALLDRGATPEALTTGAGEEDVIAVLTPSGAVLAGTGVADPATLATLVPGTVVGLDVTLTEDGHEEGEEGEAHRLRVATEASADARRVVVGRATESIDDDLKAARNLLLLGVPIVLALAAVLVWVVVGRALRPVDRLRKDVDAIVETGAGQRVGPPGTADEIDRLASTMNDMLGRLDDQAESRRRFVSDASHELKSPVANVRALVESEGDDLTPEQWADLRTALVGESSRLQLLVDDLLFLARGDEGRLEPARAVVHLDDVVFDEAERLVPLTAVIVDASAVTPVDVVGDQAQLARLVRNLVENAARHATTRVRLDLRAAGRAGPPGRGRRRTRASPRTSKPGSSSASPASKRAGTAPRAAQASGWPSWPRSPTTTAAGCEVGTAEDGGAAFIVELPAVGESD